VKKRIILKRFLTVDIILVVLVLFGFSTSVNAQTADIQPYSVNNSYWQYKGKPIMLLGTSVTDHLFLADGYEVSSLRSHLDEIKAIGTNYVRNTMSQREDWPLVAYFRRSDGKFDLNRFNDGYWQRFSDFLQWTHDRGIIVQIELWDRFDFSRSNWDKSPWNPINNINYSTTQSGFAKSYPNHPSKDLQPFFYGVPGHPNYNSASASRKAKYDLVRGYQESFVSKMLSYSLNYDHVLYTMNNETSTHANWGKYWMAHMKKAATSKGKTVYTTDMVDNVWDPQNSTALKAQLADPATYPFIDVSQVNSRSRGNGVREHSQHHWDRIKWIVDQAASVPRPLNNVKVYSTGYFGSSGAFPDDGPYMGANRMFMNMIAGAATSRHHRTSNLVWKLLNENSIRALRKVETRLAFWEVKPRMDLLSSRSVGEAFLAADPGSKYLLFFPAGGSVGLDLRDYGGTKFTLEWMKLSTGVWGSSSTVDGGNTVTINAPSSDEWAAVLTSISLSPPPPPPPPPTFTGQNLVSLGKCLTAEGSSIRSNVGIDQCDGRSGQLWSYTSQGELKNGTFCLDVWGAQTTAGTNLQLYTCHGGTNQEWIQSGTTYSPAHALSLCMDIKGASSANGTNNVLVWTCHGGSNQSWAVQATSGTPPPPAPTPSTKFQINDLVETTATLNVRRSANGTLLGTQVKGAQGTVIGGPVFENNLFWWNINFDNAPDGWSAEDWLIVAAPPPPPPPPTAATPSQYEIPVILPSCDAANSEVQIIKSNADWNNINSSSKRIFCVKPGDYTGVGKITLTASGVSSNKRYLRYYDPADPSGKTHPVKMIESKRAVVQQLEFSGGAYWVVDGLTARRSSGGALVLFANVTGTNFNIVNRILAEGGGSGQIDFKGPGTDNTIQNSVIRKTVLVPQRDIHCVWVGPGSTNARIVSNEIVDCAGDGIQTHRNGSDGVIIADNDIYLTSAMYRNVNGEERACAENALDFKGGSRVTGQTTSDKWMRVENNRIWGFRRTYTNCGGDGSAGEAVNMHGSARNIFFKGNIVFDSPYGVSSPNTSPTNNSLIDNLFYDIKNISIADLGKAQKWEVYLNTIVQTPKWISGAKSVHDIRCNILVSAGAAGGSGGADYNVYYNTPGRLSGGSDLVFTNAADSKNTDFCFERKLWTGKETVCIPNAKPTAGSPHLNYSFCDASLGSRTGIGVDNRIGVAAFDPSLFDSTGSTPPPPPPPSSSADINSDGKVDVIDLGILLSNWGASGSADINNDGVVDVIDLGILLSSWG